MKLGGGDRTDNGIMGVGLCWEISQRDTAGRILISIVPYHTQGYVQKNVHLAPETGTMPHFKNVTDLINKGRCGFHTWGEGVHHREATGAEVHRRPEEETARSFQR